MPIVVTPELGIPLPFDTTPEELTDFREKAHALCATVEELIKNGAEVEVTDNDKSTSHHLLTANNLPNPKDMTPGTILNLEAMLCEWDQEVLDVARRLRNYVTNKLIAESNDPDPKIRIKALELLGKVSSVGLFAERVDVNVTHRTITDIEIELKKTLELYGGKKIDVEDAVINEKGSGKSVADLDFDVELGLVEEKKDEKQENTQTQHETDE